MQLIDYLQVLSGSSDYVLKNNFSATVASKELNCTRQTVYNKINKLKREKVIIEHSDRYIINTINPYSSLPTETTRYLYQFKIEGLMAVFIFIRNLGRNIFSTLTLMKTFNLPSNNILFILETLTRLGLIKLERQDATHYKVTEINDFVYPII